MHKHGRLHILDFVKQCYFLSSEYIVHPELGGEAARLGCSKAVLAEASDVLRQRQQAAIGFLNTVALEGDAAAFARGLAAARMVCSGLCC